MSWLKKLIAFLKKLYSTQETETTGGSTGIPPAYIVSKGQRVEKKLKTPCSLVFEITNYAHTPTNDDQLEEHLAWAVEFGKEWDGGNPVPNKVVYAASAKDYKLKCNGFGEKRFPMTWYATQTYHFELLIGSDNTRERISVNGSVVADVSVDLPAPEFVTVGYGWPPSKRNGADGARISNVVWTGEAL